MKGSSDSPCIALPEPLLEELVDFFRGDALAALELRGAFLEACELLWAEGREWERFIFQMRREDFVRELILGSSGPGGGILKN